MLIVFNPTAGRRRHARLRRALDALARRGIVATLVETTAPGDACRIARDGAALGESVVVAAGGDGTIAEVADGIAGSGATLGLLPLGTANVLAWELGVPLCPDRAASVLAEGHRRAIRPGFARRPDGSERLFVQMFGAGFDAAVVHGVDLGLKRRLGKGAYVLQGLRAVLRYGFPPIRVALDGGVAMEAANVIVSKGRLYAGRHLLAPAARPGAPGFQVAIFPAGGPWHAMLHGAALPLDLLPRMPGVVLREAMRVELGGAEAVLAQADGDPAGMLPVSISDAPAEVPVLVPA